MPKLLITGGSGFIGYHFHQALPNLSITNLDLVQPDFNASSRFIKGDIRLKKEVEKAIEESQCDTILNLAAVHDDFGRSQTDYFDTNEGGMKVICKAASKYHIKKIIFFSTVAVYGNKPTPTHEKMIPKPTNPYGASKLAAEKILRNWATEDNSRSAIILRPALIYGEGNRANMYRLIQQIQKGRYLHIGKGDNIKSIGYVKNLVAATQYLTKRLQTGVHIYNFAGESQLSSRGIATIIIKALGKKDAPTLPYWFAYLMGIPFDIAIKITGLNLPISTNRIEKFCTPTYHRADKLQAIGFSSNWSNEEGLVNMVQWYLAINKEVSKRKLVPSLLRFFS